MSEPEGRAPSHCPSCGTEIAASRLACPACQRLVHADRLRELASHAEAAARTGRPADALAAWREALELLPPESTQSQLIAGRLARLSGAGIREDTAARRPAWARGAGILGFLGLLLWKLKFLLVLALTKAKLLVSGLAKAGTLLSMLASLGLYWTAWGWRFALGLVLSIYVHEMGHVAALRRLGIRASAPMFVPGFGALVRMRQRPASPHEDARVGLAGPVWGLAAAVACAAAFLVTRHPYWAAMTQWGCRINLFNLIPLPPLDGGRGMAPLSRSQGLLVVGTVGLALLLTGEGMLWLLLIAGAFRLFSATPAGPGDRRASVTFAALVVLLSSLAAWSVPATAP
jgi:Zn-dependent protease